MNKFLSFFLPSASPEKIEFYHIRNNKKTKAIIYKPKRSGTFPLLVFDIGLRYRIWKFPIAIKFLTSLGFSVLGTSYSKIEVAKGEVADITNSIDYALKEFPFLKNQIVLVGISMGASLMLSIAAKDKDRFNIIGMVAVAPFADLMRAHYYAQGFIDMHKREDAKSRILKLYLNYAFTTPDEMPKEYYVRSPINFVEKIECPVLLIHGKNDKIITADHSIELYHKMKSLKKDVRLRIVRGEGIHTSLYFSDMVKNFNFIGFMEIWLHIKKFLEEMLRKISNKK